MDKLKILGIWISNLSQNIVLEKIKQFLLDKDRHFIVTPNPEIILEAQKNEELYYILNNADLAVADGFGLKITAWLSGQNLKRVTGSDLSEALLKFCEKEKITIGWLIWEKGLSSKSDLERSLRNKYPNLSFTIEEKEKNNDLPPSQEFLSAEAKIIFVTFGSPWQEKYIYHHLSEMGAAKILLGVGGTADYLTGKIKRAPKMLRIVGLEWLWRLLQQPKRFKRIFRAVVVFPLCFIKRQFIHPLFYRPNVSCLLYKKDNGRYKILLVERQDEHGHWQLPQGGTDGEDILTAGARELREEINCDRFIAKRVYKNIFKYTFGDRPGETLNKAQNSRRSTGFKGQKQSLFIAEFSGQDQDIKLNFWDHCSWKWVESEKLVDEVNLIRRRGAEIFLKKFKEFVKQK